MKALSELTRASSIDDFIQFFESIPADRWCTHILHDPTTGQCCALGHLGGRPKYLSDLEDRLLRLVGSNIVEANNGELTWVPGDDPKERTLNYLRMVKDDPSLRNL